jgi:hypothetical protein
MTWSSHSIREQLWPGHDGPKTRTFRDSKSQPQTPAESETPLWVPRGLTAVDHNHGCRCVDIVTRVRPTLATEAAVDKSVPRKDQPR